MTSEHSADSLAIVIQEFQSEVREARKENAIFVQQNEELAKTMEKMQV